MAKESCEDVVVIYRPYITLKNGQRIYPKNSKFFRLEIPRDKYRG